MKRSVVITMSLAVLLVLASGYAQAQTLVSGKIGFSFTAGSKALPAGQYEFVFDSAKSVIRVVSGGKHLALLPVITRLSKTMHTTPKDSHIVFDRAGQTPLLSEIWVPGQDGFLLANTKGQHEHDVVDVAR